MERKKLKQSKTRKLGLYFDRPNLEFISSGCVLLDCVLGGGWPLGRISNIIGDKSTGKTLLAIEACANFHRQFPDGQIFFRERESAFDTDYAQLLGLPVGNIDFEEGGADFENIEGWFEDMEEVCKDDSPKLYVVDSLDGLSDVAEEKRKIGEGTYGTKAKQMSTLFRKTKMTKKLEQSNTHLMVISQTRDKIGVTFGKRYTRSGGKALDFYASQILYLAEISKRIKTYKKIKRATGVNIKARTDKCKVGFPYRDCTFPVIFAFGIDSVTAGLEFLYDVGKAKQVDSSLTKKEKIKEVASKLYTLPKNERRKQIQQLNETVKTVWYEIEEGFLPDMRKYE